MLCTRKMVVKGKVQGVFFRRSAKTMALECGITGTVQNQRDGSVLIIATGTSAQLEQLEAWCAQGPPRATVASVEVVDLPVVPFGDFSIL